MIGLILFLLGLFLLGTIVGILPGLFFMAVGLFFMYISAAIKLGDSLHQDDE